MNELGGNLYLFNFSFKDKNKMCWYLKDGLFYVGVGEIKNEICNEIEIGWFIVNYLYNLMLIGDEYNCD